MQAHDPGVDAAYRSLFDQNPHPMWVFDRSSYRFLAVNDAAVRQYGYSREGFLDLTILDIRPEEDAPMAAEDVQQMPSEPAVWRHRRKDGSILLAEVTAQSIAFMGHDARLVMAIDVTARERGLEALRRANGMLRAVLEAAPVGMLVFDGTGRIVETNERARQLLGTKGLEPIAGTVNAVLGGEGFLCAEVEADDGKWSEVAASTVDIAPNLRGAVAVLSDCTERRAREGTLERNVESLETRVRERTEELESSLADIDGLCFSVSHDLRGPLRAVDGFAQLVLSDEESTLSSESVDALGRVRGAARRMGDLIDGILALSRLSRAPFEPKPLDLSAIAFRAADAIVQANPDRQFSFDIKPGLVAHGDPRMVTLLIDVLFSNAAKFTAEREVATIVLGQFGRGWSVRDNGVGFDMAYSARLFQPFERLHKAGEFPGNGLGLALAQRIIRRHGGTIDAVSAPGEGATFRFDLGQAEKP